MARQFETKLEKITPKYKDKYLIEIKCDFNDGDFVNSKLILEPSEFTDFKKLILSYVMTDYNRYHIPEDESFGDSCYSGTYAGVGDNWLVNYLIDNGFLLYGYEGYCHSIVSLDITYYDKNGEAFNVPLIDIRKEFGSITEFRKFITSCEDYDGDLVVEEEADLNLDFGEYPEDDDDDNDDNGDTIEWTKFNNENAFDPETQIRIADYDSLTGRQTFTIVNKDDFDQVDFIKDETLKFLMGNAKLSKYCDDTTLLYFYREIKKI